MFQQPNLIGVGQTAPSRFLPPLQQARASGPIEEYKFVNIKPKKKLKEIRKVLYPEKKTFLKIKYSNKFNLKDRCVVCGMHHLWDSGDFMRPPIPLTDVTKGRPMRGTYCPKHAGTHKQLEMLQQQILAEEHGLEFRAFIPKMPKMMKRGPITNLSKEEVAALLSAGWLIKPPSLGDTKTATTEAINVVAEINILTDRLNYLMIKQGVQAANTETEE